MINHEAEIEVDQSRDNIVKPEKGIGLIPCLLVIGAVILFVYLLAPSHHR